MSTILCVTGNSDFSAFPRQERAQSLQEYNDEELHFFWFLKNYYLFFSQYINNINGIPSGRGSLTITRPSNELKNFTSTLPMHYFSIGPVGLRYNFSSPFLFFFPLNKGIFLYRTHNLPFAKQWNCIK